MNKTTARPPDGTVRPYDQTIFSKNTAGAYGRCYLANHGRGHRRRTAAASGGGYRGEFSGGGGRHPGRPAGARLADAARSQRRNHRGRGGRQRNIAGASGGGDSGLWQTPHRPAAAALYRQCRHGRLGRHRAAALRGLRSAFNALPPALAARFVVSP